MPSLRIKLPNNQGEVTHVLTGDKVTIGRRPENTIQIIDRTVSAHHAELVKVGNHYRLHDLGSTNLTCVESQPVTDFHLHKACKILFGTVEAEYTLESPVVAVPKKAEPAPTAAEMEFVRRENLDLQTKIAAQQKQIDILSSARLMTKETSQLGVQPEVHRRLVGEHEALKKQAANLEHEVENLRCDLATIARDRDALRQAWETVKEELGQAEREIESLRSGPPARPASRPAAVAAVAPSPSASAAPAARAEAPAAPPIDQHRQMANVLTTAPGLIESIREALQKLATAPGDFALRTELSIQAGALASATSAVQGHPIQRLGAAIDAVIRDLPPEAEALSPPTLRGLNEASELLLALLDPRALKRAKTLQPHRVLALEEENQASLATLVASLETADLQPTTRHTLPQARAEIRSQQFDLILLGLPLPETEDGDFCAEIRTMPGYGQTPVIRLGTPASEEATTAWANSGGTDWVNKPFNPSELTLKAQTLIYRNQFALA